MSRVDLLLHKSRLPMQSVGGGWWESAADETAPGTQYAFSLAGGPARPDPRSHFQPLGLKGPSEVVDHCAFQWSDRGWRGMSLRGSVIYELHVGTFTPEGTFDSAIERLSHLVDLGITAVELMPVAEFPGRRGWGYDGIALYAPHHAYGGPQALKRFVDASHAAGLGVILDVVYNHFGPGHRLEEFGPYFTQRYATLWGAALNFDGPGSDVVRQYVLDNARMWLRDYHLDGLRLDSVHAIADTSALHILDELACGVKALGSQLGKKLVLIAESDLNDPRIVRSRDAGGLGLDAAWADDWHHALHATLTGERAGYYVDFGSLESLAKALTQAWVHDGTRSEYRGRRHGQSPGGLSAEQFVIATQTHDQVGNRALGDRLGALVSCRRAKIAAALLFTAPFTPMLFQGEEWAASTPFQYFTDHDDPELGRAVSEGRRREFAAFGWNPSAVPDPQAPETFARSRLDWSELSGPSHREMLAWYRELIDLRRGRSDLTDPRLASPEVTYSQDDQWIVVRRGGRSVVASLAGCERTVPIGPSTLILASDPATRCTPEGIVMPGESVAIVESMAGPMRVAK